MDFENFNGVPALTAMMNEQLFRRSDPVDSENRFCPSHVAPLQFQQPRSESLKSPSLSFERADRIGKNATMNIDLAQTDASLSSDEFERDALVTKMCESLLESDAPVDTKPYPSETSSTEQVNPQAFLPCRIGNADLLLLHRVLVTLYTDQIIPTVFNLKGRLREFGCSHLVNTNFIAIYALFPTLYRIEWLPRQGERAVFFTIDPPNAKGWIDINDSHDPYPPSMWAEFSNFLYDTFLRSSAPNGIGGGRYGLAKYLKQLDLPFFKGFSLGQLCHVVQLAISSKFLLAYEDNVLKPVTACAVFANALLGLPDAKRRGKKCITDIREIQVCIEYLLQRHPTGFTLSTLKRKLKDLYGRELCQTVFHCAKLVDLMNLPELRKVCLIAKDARHIKVVPPEIPIAPEQPQERTLNISSLPPPPPPPQVCSGAHRQLTNMASW
uniref:Uncharacterized protein n=1 Tax=Neospora caninum (strain Liverpool) TaxID=572307 RepID=A0A0F7UBQ2_NEOCL|nr:TPA: hypothetical protein BN1204_018920 [Neospora caninum Liverpool]